MSEADLNWADVVLVMESRHRDQLIRRFGVTARSAEIAVLGIEDDYRLMDPELMERLEDAVPRAIASVERD